MNRSPWRWKNPFYFDSEQQSDQISDRCVEETSKYKLVTPCVTNGKNIMKSYILENECNQQTGFSLRLQAELI